MAGPSSPPSPAAAPQYRSIIIPLDGSALSQRALAAGLDLASHYGSTVELVHVIDKRILSAMEVGVPHQARNEVLRKLENYGTFVLDQAAKQATQMGVLHHRTLTRGKVVVEIVRAAQRMSADLVVMGTHGSVPYSPLRLGSVAEGVAHKVTCSVMLVRDNTPDTSPR